MDKNKLEELVSSKMTQDQIAKELGVSQTTIRYWLKKFGLKTLWDGNLMRKTPDHILLAAAKKAQSQNELLESIGAKNSGGAFYHYKKRLTILGFDFSIWKFNGQSGGGRRTALNLNAKALSKETRLPRRTLHKFLSANNRLYQCERCTLTHWMGKLLLLQIHHKDHNCKNNALDNLQYLCPNCHSVDHN